MAQGSKKVVVAALAGNLLVTLSKFGAAAVSGSSAMLTEAVHSLADAINQVLLLIGGKRSAAAPDASHPFGYGMEIYFWAFVVAVMVLLAGGAVSITQGWRELHDPRPIASPLVSLGVLALSVLFEGYSLSVSVREYRRLVTLRGDDPGRISVWSFIQRSKDPSLYESLLEDIAALAGILIAAAGIAASVWLNWLWADGVSSIAIGLLLVANALIIARATRSLIAGESMDEHAVQRLQDALAATCGAGRFHDLRTLHLGPAVVLLTVRVALPRSMTVEESESFLRGLVSRLKAVDPRIRYVSFDAGGEGRGEHDQDQGVPPSRPS